MAHIRTKTIRDGVETETRFEAPTAIGKDGKPRLALAFLLPSGATELHPMYEHAKKRGIPDEDIPTSHRGVDGHGHEYVSDQRWIFEAAELAELEQTCPERLIRVE